MKIRSFQIFAIFALLVVISGCDSAGLVAEEESQILNSTPSAAAAACLEPARENGRIYPSNITNSMEYISPVVCTRNNGADPELYFNASLVMPDSWMQDIHESQNGFNAPYFKVHIYAVPEVDWRWGGNPYSDIFKIETFDMPNNTTSRREYSNFDKNVYIYFKMTRNIPAGSYFGHEVTGSFFFDLEENE